MPYRTMTTPALLEVLLGAETTQATYTGTLRPLFEGGDDGDSRDVAPLHAARELVLRWLAEEITERPLFDSPNAVREYLRLTFAGQDHESFMTLYVDTQHRLIVAEESFRGTLSQTAVYPREIVKRALAVNAAAVVFAHNHPSGVAEPSRADEMLTQSLKAALAIVDVRVVDHFVVGATGVVSFSERGLL